MEPQQDAILSLAKLATELEGNQLAAANSSLEGFRKWDKELRSRLFILQVWPSSITRRQINWLKRRPESTRIQTSPRSWRIAKKPKKGRRGTRKEHAKFRRRSHFHPPVSKGAGQWGQPTFERLVKQALQWPQPTANTGKVPEVTEPEVAGEVEQATRHQKRTKIVLSVENQAIFSTNAQTKSNNPDYKFLNNKNSPKTNLYLDKIYL